MVKSFFQNKIFHGLFELTLLAKGINGIWETLVGVLFFFFKTETIYNFIIYFTGDQYLAGRRHFASNYLINQANDFSLSTQRFIAIYFLFYGVVNIFLVIFLSKGKVWAYPTAIAFFALFIVYQIYRYFLYHSGLLLLFIIFDILLTILTWIEYQRIQKNKSDLIV